MKISENSTEGAFNATGSGREPHGVIFDPNMDWPGNLDLNKWLKDTMRQFDGMPFIGMPDSPANNFHPTRPSGNGPPIERPHVDNRIEPDFKMFNFKAYMPTPPPPRHSPGFTTVRTLGGAVAGVAVLMILARCIRGKASRTPRGRVVGAGAVQQGRRNISTDQPSIPDYPRRPTEQAELGRPLNNDLPPSYYECALSSIKKYVSDEPPPYTYSKEAEPEVHTRRQNALIENGLRADAAALTNTSNDSEDVTPGMKTELVFDNGRIVERLSLDLNSNNKETGIASNNYIEQQSTRHANVKDRVVYVDETDNVKVNTQ